MAHSNEVQYHLQLGERGRLVLPAEVRESLHLHKGDELVLTVSPGGVLKLVSLRDQLDKLQGVFASFSPERVLSEELMAERRAEAALENAS